jgi:hypothetical protein
MKQVFIFNMPEPEEKEKKYSTAIDTPIYEPKNKKPHLLELVDTSKTERLINEIKASALPEDEKQFLIVAAYRHAVFHYERIADYYAHSSKEMQANMEKSALVIIDFSKAIEGGYIQLCKDIQKQYLEDYSDAE